MQAVFGTKETRRGESRWTEQDFNYVGSKLSKICVCNGGRLGLTAEFGLRRGAISAVLGDRKTALWQLSAEQPHPDLGGGLLCVLQLPHCVPRERVAEILQDLNRAEMAPADRPPHFGAWCQGSSESTMAYVSFLPNFMHDIEGVALNASVWGFYRAHWADAHLTSIGTHL